MLSELLGQLLGYSIFYDRIFRIGAATICASFIVFLFMPYYIKFLKQKNAVADFINPNTTQLPPIFGGALLVISIIISTMLFAKINAFVIAILIILIAYSIVGFIDDYVKIKTNKLIAEGKKQKASYQEKADGISSRLRLVLYFLFSLIVAIFAYYFIPGLDGHLTIPFIKPQRWYPELHPLLFILLISFVTTSTANGANFTDGMDTLVSIPIITTSIFVGVVAYISGNAIFSKYLLLPHLPGVDEVAIISAAICGAMLSYLWYNCPPAQIYMGDSGSIGIGGAIGMMFVLIKAELFLPIIGFIFVMEAISVVFQISGFKLTRALSKDHQGRRIFLRAPIHDHYKLLWKDYYGSTEAAKSKVIWRFHIISIITLIIGSLIFFKVR